MELVPEVSTWEKSSGSPITECNSNLAAPFIPRAVMDIANGLLGAQMFKFGWVHCDPVSKVRYKLWVATADFAWHLRNLYSTRAICSSDRTLRIHANHN